MNVEAVFNLLISDSDPDSILSTALPDDVASAVIERLKQEADRHWRIDPHRSLVFADQIIQIGLARDDQRQTALGMMARGDALRFLGRLEDAWNTLEDAGTLFLSAGDEVGWARTRIGRLLIGADVNRLDEVLADSQRAQDIFDRYGEHEKLLRLTLNTAIVYSDRLGDHQHALILYRSAVNIAEGLGSIGEDYLGLIYLNVGYAYNYLSDFREALAYYERASELFVKQNNISEAALAEQNIAYIAQAQGRYRYALRLSLLAQEHLAANRPTEAAVIERDIVECYLALNRYLEARDLALSVVDKFRTLGAGNELARTLLHLAVAEAELSNLDAAQSALDVAERSFAALGAAVWVATVRLRRGRIALQQGDIEKARLEAAAAAVTFQSASLRASYGEAVLLDGQALYTSGDLESAAQAGKTALHIAQQCNLSALRYSSHLLLGAIWEAQHDSRRAIRQYRAAAATVERVQRGLTITLRPGFLEDKGEALKAIIRLQLRAGQTRQAFESLERAKSQVLLGYLANREHLKWMHDDAQTHLLINELEQLRSEHQWFYQLATNRSMTDDHAVQPEQARAEVASRERRMRAITEQLYLHSGDSGATNAIAMFSLDDIQHSLTAGSLLIEFYNDGDHLWVFTLDDTTLNVFPLPITVKALDQLIAQLQFNLACALKAGPSGVATVQLTKLFDQLAQRLYTMLIEPLAAQLQGRPRLVIVPYGSLHYLPFHLLRSRAGYLIEQAEVVILPAAGLAAHRGPVRKGGALILAHSLEGQLPHTLREADSVYALLDGEIYHDGAASRVTLQLAPRQVLHIAAHGEYRMDQPDLSYIQLADGQLYTDDILQNDLSYELVTLSACETGRANVVAGDELIGLGRGFLYAGAGALVTSLWKVNDSLAITLMEYFYTALQGGSSKAAALRSAQRTMRRESPHLHPAYWGAFQLVGDASPLSVVSDLLVPKEQDRVNVAGQ